MKIRIILTFCIIIILICVVCFYHISNKNDEDYNYKNAGMIKDANYEGVILANDANWTPDEESIKQFEIGLEEYLNGIIRSGGVDEEGITYDVENLKYIIQNIKLYKRQYMGVSRSTNKIYCNFIILPEDSDWFIDWKNNLIQFLDGGPNFFSIYYKIKSKKYFDLMINGYA